MLMNSFIQDLIRKPWVINKSLQCINIYNDARDYIKNVYNSNALFKTSVDVIYTNSYIVICYLMNVKYQPNAMNWQTNCLLYEHTHNKNSLHFMIEDRTILPDYFDKKNINKTLEESNDKLVNEYVNYGNICDSLYLMKYYNSVISKINMYTDLKMQEIEKSDVSFLTIEYSHPSMKNKITFYLDDSYFLVGNELFSPCFVKRLLEYQFSPYVFNNNYKIVIIDADTNEYILEFNNYLRIEKDKCIVEKCE